MSFTVYLLGICGSVSTAFMLLALMGFFGATLVLVGSEGTLQKLTVQILAGSILCLLLAALIPSADNLKQAYLYTEASKIVTAENGTQTVEEIAKRVDRVLEIFKKKEETE